MQTRMRAFVNIVYDHAREVEETDLASTIVSAIQFLNIANLFDCTNEEDWVTLAIPVTISLSIGTVWPGGATMKIGDTIVVKDAREIIAE